MGCSVRWLRRDVRGPREQDASDGKRGTLQVAVETVEMVNGLNFRTMRSLQTGRSVHTRNDRAALLYLDQSGASEHDKLIIVYSSTRYKVLSLY